MALTKTRHASSKPSETERAVIAAGCFWGVEQEFRKEKGVLATQVGYIGGQTKHPTYEQVCEGDTGHAEGVEIEFDPAQISYEKLLDIFWSLHDPTTLNRQGPDVGHQYRSAIFTFSETQKKSAITTRDALQKSGELKAPIVTEIIAATQFWPAEEYHQQYVEKGGYAVCHFRRPRPI